VFEVKVLEELLYLILLDVLFPIDFFRFSSIVGLSPVNYAKLVSIIIAFVLSAALFVGTVWLTIRSSGDKKPRSLLAGAFAVSVPTMFSATMAYVQLMFLDYPNMFFSPQAYLYAKLELVLAVFILVFVWMFYCNILEWDKSPKNTAKALYAGVTVLLLIIAGINAASPVTIHETLSGVISFDMPALQTLIYGIIFIVVNLPVAAVMLYTYRRVGIKSYLYMGAGAFAVGISLVFNILAYITSDVLSAFLVWGLPALGLVLLFMAIVQPRLKAVMV
jgi:hypothetical protein